MARLALLCLVVVVTCQLTLAVETGTKIQISQNGLNYSAGVAVDILSDKVMSIKLPELSGTKRFLFVKIKYSAYDIKITRFDKPAALVTIQPNSGMTWELNNAGISVTGRWKFSFDRGSLDLSVEGLTVKVSVTLGRDGAGRPTIRTTSCQSNIRDVKVKFRGSILSFLYNLIAGFAKGKIRSTLEKEVCKAAEKVVNENAASELATFPTTVKIDSRFLVDYSLTQNPFYGPGYFQTSHSGEVRRINDNSHAPLRARNIPTTAPSRMVTVYVSEYVANTLGYVLHKYNILQYTAKKEDVGAGSQVFFQTTCSASDTCLGTVFPELAVAYPNSEGELSLSTSSAPAMIISPSGISGTFSGQAVILIRRPNGSTVNVLTLNVNLTATVRVGVSGDRITGTVTSLQPRVSVMSSQIGSVQEAALNQLLNLLSTVFIIPHLNEVGARGLEIPTVAKLNFVGPSISLINGAAVVSTDVRYIP